MIHLVTRFRVAAGQERAVRPALRDRPREVDRAAGFLGLDVFADAADPGVFVLVTRWADPAAAAGWHDERALSRLLPGLPVEPGSAKTAALERLAAADGPTLCEAAATPVVAAFLAESHTAHLLAAAADGTIRLVNQALAAALGVEAADLMGRPAWDLLTESDAARLRQWAARGGPEAPFLLNFVDARQVPFTLRCRCAAWADGFLLLGEPAADRAEAFQEEWQRMNNDLAVLTRENARRNKELEQARRDLEKALTDLRDSHWHLRKLQEVLPICMECGKVKAGGRWEDVAQYLKANARFLSHGYCPECLVRVAAQWGLPPGALSS